MFYLVSLLKEPGFNLIHFFCPVSVQHHVPKPKPNKTNSEVEPRRSSRVRNPVPSYQEDVSNVLFQTNIIQDKTRSM